MPRSPRPNVPGSLHHVILRGNNRQEVFTTAGTRVTFLEHVGEAVERLGCKVHAFCLMTNHIHVAIEQGDVSLSRVVQFLAQRHAVETNRARGASGHLFQGRFSSFPVETDGYVLELARYIHLNPVRAGLVPAPEGWPWSSHRAYVGLASHRFLTTELVLGMLGTPAEAPSRFRDFVLEGMRPGEDSRRTVPAGHPVPLDHVLSIFLAGTDLTEADLSSEKRHRRLTRARAEVAWLAARTPSAKLTEVARRFNRDVSTLSEAVTRLEATLAGDPSRQRRLDELLLRCQA